MIGRERVVPSPRRWAWRAAIALLASTGGAAAALDRADPPFKIFQFPADAIPRIDGDPSDWAMVGADYAIPLARLAADDGSGRHPDPASLRGQVRVGWVKGLNRLYLLYEADDDDWDFAAPGLSGDMFELVVDGDRSGGPFISRFDPEAMAQPGASPAVARTAEQSWWGFQNRQAQNYHIFTPPGDRDWAMAWGPQAAWLKQLPYANAAYRYDFRPGQAGHLTLEFWITPFDLAAADGPGQSVESQLREGDVIGLAWAVIDSDGPGKRRFWNLSPHHTMYGQASELCAFRLMPLEPALAPRLSADWRFTVLDRAAHLVAFHQDATGRVAHWRWDFGDGTGSTAPDPVHRYAAPGKFVVTLAVDGPDGSARHTKVWDVSFVGDPQ